MRMTPLEIQSHRFGRRFRGYDRDEVEAFLRMITEDYETLLKENESQRDRVRTLEKQLEGLTEQERLLKHTLLGAQSISDKMRETAEHECNALIGEAEVRAEKILDASHRRAARIAENIRELRGVRTSLAEALRSAIETHLGLIGNLSKDPIEDSLIEGMVDGKITYLAASAPARTKQARASGRDEDGSPQSESSGGA